MFVTWSTATVGIDGMMVVFLFVLLSCIYEEEVWVTLQ